MIRKTPIYSTKLFSDIWDNPDDFYSDYSNTPLVNLEEEDVNRLFFLLYAEYGNSPIANRDVNQFKFKTFSIMYQYGPYWVEQLRMQGEIIALTDEDIIEGTKLVFNHAYNPSAQPGTNTVDELTYIDSQNTNNTKRGKLEAYAYKSSLLATDFTAEFLAKFRPLFKQFVASERPLLFVTEEDDDETEED